MAKVVFILCCLAGTVFSLPGLGTTEGERNTEDQRSTVPKYTTKDYGQTDPEVTPNPEVPCRYSKDAYFETDPRNCSNYYFCVGSLPSLRHCPKGTYFDLSVCACNFAHLVTDCAAEPLCKKGETSLKPLPRECSSYIFCADGHAGIRQCPTSMNFDPELLECNDEKLVDCLRQPTSAPSLFELDRLHDSCTPVEFPYPEM